jgi:hypothetical protein
LTAYTLEADAEAGQSANLENKRKHEQRMLVARNNAAIAKNNKIVISGKNGEELLNFFQQTNDQVFNLND